MIPPLIREETYHPLTVHLPIGVLPVATLFLLGYLLLARRFPRFAFLLPATRLLLSIGVVGAWIAVFTGDMAEEVVNRVLCDPTITHAHEDLSEWAAIAFTIALTTQLVSAVFAFSPTRARTAVWLNLLTLLTMIAGTTYLIRTTHLGASLVYQQGAAVYHPTAECKEFE